MDHWNTVKRVIRYLKATPSVGITYQSTELVLTGHTDTDWGQNLSDRCSISGYVFLSGNAPVSWSSKKQPTVAQSSMEAEFIALAHATKEALWLRTLYEQLGFPQSTPTPIHCDNQSAITFSHDSQFHAHSKHIDIKYYFVRDTITNRQISINYVPTHSNCADLLTKPLPRPSHSCAISLLGLSCN